MRKTLLDPSAAVTKETQMSQETTKIILFQPALDWLTLTTFMGKTSDRVFSEWMRASQGLAEERNGRVMIEEKRRGRYEGVIVNGVFFGKGTQKQKEHFMIQAPGPVANMLANECESAVECRCTRMDIQLTVPLPYGYSALLLRDQLENAKWKTRTPKIVGVHQKSGMDTVYVGAPTSNKRIRIYVKEGESGERYLRFELQLRRDYAESVWAHANSGTDSPWKTYGGTLKRILIDIDHAVTSLNEIRVALTDAIEVDVPPRQRTSKDFERTKQWISKQVSPAVYRLIQSGSDERQYVRAILNKWQQ